MKEDTKVEIIEGLKLFGSFILIFGGLILFGIWLTYNFTYGG